MTGSACSIGRSCTFTPRVVRFTLRLLTTQPAAATAWQTDRAAPDPFAQRTGVQVDDLHPKLIAHDPRKIEQPNFRSPSPPSAICRNNDDVVIPTSPAHAALGVIAARAESDQPPARAAQSVQTARGKRVESLQQRLQRLLDRLRPDFIPLLVGMGEVGHRAPSKSRHPASGTSTRYRGRTHACRRASGAMAELISRICTRCG